MFLVFERFAHQINLPLNLLESIRKKNKIAAFLSDQDGDDKVSTERE